MATTSEGRISSLCAELLTASDPQTVQTLAEELQKTLQEHIEDLRKRLLEVPATPAPFHPSWNRKAES